MKVEETQKCQATNKRIGGAARGTMPNLGLRSEDGTGDGKVLFEVCRWHL